MKLMMKLELVVIMCLSKLLDSDDINDFFDQSELLQELEELSNMQKAMSVAARNLDN